MTTRNVTYLPYESVIDTCIQMGNLWFPVKYLSDSSIGQIIDDLIVGFQPNNAIGFTSFLNMVCQSSHIDLSIGLSINELRKTQLAQNVREGVVFYRDSLLFLITQIIENNVSGDELVADSNVDFNVARKYYKAMLLTNTRLNNLQAGEPSLLKDILIRAHPCYYKQEYLLDIYMKKFKRYEYVYGGLLEAMPEDKRTVIQSGIEKLEDKVDTSLKEYFNAIHEALAWFILGPYLRKRDGANQAGFHHQNPSSFYIHKDNFPTDHPLLKLCEYFGKDQEELRQAFISKREAQRYEIDNVFYQNVQTLFDYPIFKLADGGYCIIDLKFLLEGICGGFVWQLQSLIDCNPRDIIDKYGALMEKYFLFLINNIFQDSALTADDDGMPDAIVEDDETIVIFEFTVEYYRLCSLYDAQYGRFSDDLHRLLFNQGQDDPRARGKRDRGKMFKLASYIEHQQDKGKRIIPVLVTENYLGDWDLLNRFNNFIDEELEDNDLESFHEHKPLLMNLDQLESFWEMSPKEDALHKFVELHDEWDSIDKGQSQYNFDFFLKTKAQGGQRNSASLEFFKFDDEASTDKQDHKGEKAGIVQKYIL